MRRHVIPLIGRSLVGRTFVQQVSKTLLFIAIVILAISTKSSLSQGRSFAADESSSNAYRLYWEAFEEYEARLAKKRSRDLQRQWTNLSSTHDVISRQADKRELKDLQETATKYRRQLENYPDAENRPRVLMNLAQILNLIADKLMAEDPDGGTFTRSEALAILDKVVSSHKTFSDVDQALYLQAVSLESMDRKSEAIKVWRTLGEMELNSFYSAFGSMALGDAAFESERPSEALTYYQQASKKLTNFRPKNFNSMSAEIVQRESLQLAYRTAWAAYRAGDLNKTIAAASLLLTPNARTLLRDKWTQISTDASELLGDALYENSEPKQIITHLSSKALGSYSVGVGFRILQRYRASDRIQEARQLGSWLVKRYPLSEESPEILALTAKLYGNASKRRERLKHLEKLALMLPDKSLWRLRHSRALEATEVMEALSSAAARLVAEQHYQNGLMTDSKKSYNQAIAYYHLLIKALPGDSQVNDWRLRRAHATSLAGRHLLASQLYNELKTVHKVETKTLLTAAYQSVIVNAALWREEFAKLNFADDPTIDRQSLNLAIQRLQTSIDQYVGRFPDDPRSVDLLLLGAGAYRDMARLPEAIANWQRALLAQPNLYQRSAAIRGIVVGRVVSAGHGEVLETARRYLRLEDWQALGSSLGSELWSIAVTAALAEANRLSEQGDAVAAGKLLRGLADEFQSYPNRDRLLRDGGYQLAIGGDWSSAAAMARTYLDEKHQKHRGDAAYLLARSLEYQLAFGAAAQAYLDLARLAPTHAKANTGLERASLLAPGEALYDIAAGAQELLAEQSPNRSLKREHLKVAARQWHRDGNLDNFARVSNRLYKTSKTMNGRFEAQLFKMSFEVSSGQYIGSQPKKLAQAIKASREQLGDSYGQLFGEAGFYYGQHLERRFKRLVIEKRYSAAIPAAITRKTKLFEALATVYDEVATYGSPEWATRARYHLGNVAHEFSLELAAVPTSSNTSHNLTSHSRYDKEIRRLQGLASRYHTSNVLAARKNPTAHKGNDWVRRSAERLGPRGERQASLSTGLIPVATDELIPTPWSF